MQETILSVNKRTEKPKALRKKGLMPGVIYGEKFAEGVPVEFEKAIFSRIIGKHGSAAKLSIDFEGKKKKGIIKDLQRDNLSHEPIHADIFVISQKQDLRMKISVVYTGIPALEHRELILQTYNSKIDISGKPDLIPESIVYDVSEKELHDTITVADLGLDDGLKIHNDPAETLAVVSEIKHRAEVVEEVETVASLSEPEKETVPEAAAETAAKVEEQKAPENEEAPAE